MPSAERGLDLAVEIIPGPGKAVEVDLSYNPSLFCGREKQLVQATTIFNRWYSTGEDSRSITFTGPRGIGKTWLAEKLGRKIKEETGIPVWRLDLTSHAGTTVNGQVFKLMGDLIRQVDLGNSIEGLTLPEASQKLIDSIQDKRGGKALLIVDGLSDADRALIQAMEENFLEELADDKKIFIILTGGQSDYQLYSWVSPSLRLHATFIDLAAFSPEETVEQCRLLGQEPPEWLPDAAQGNPALTAIALNSRSPKEAAQHGLAYLLEPVPRELRQEAMNLVFALCVLDGFNEGKMPVMLSNYFNQQEWLLKANINNINIMSIIDFLLKDCRLIYVDTGNMDFVFSGALRPVAEQYLKSVDPDKWAGLHKAAIDLYSSWYNRLKVKKHNQDYEKRIMLICLNKIAYHRGQLEITGYI